MPARLGRGVVVGCGPRGARAAAGSRARADCRGARGRHSQCLRVVADRPGQRMLAVAFQRRGHLEHASGRSAVQRHDVGDRGSAARERPGLVEGDRLDAGHLLEVGAALDQHAVARRASEGGEDAHRRRDDQGARAADDEQREAAVEPGVERGPEERRDEGDRRRQRHHDRCVAAREAVDDGLGRRTLRLRLLHHVDDLGDGRVRRGRGRAHVQRATLDDGAGEHLVARSFGDGDRLAGDRRLVGGGRALDDDPVDGRPLPRAYHHDVADDDVGHGDARLSHGAVVARRPQHHRGRRREPHQAADRAPRALQRGDLQHGAETEEEGDQRRLAPLADGGGADHGQGHEDVHVDLARAQAEDGGARHEEAAADDRGAEEPWRRGGGGDGRDEAGSCERAGDDGGDGPRLRQPEPEAGAGGFVLRIRLGVLGAPFHRVVPEAPHGAEDVRHPRLRRIEGDGQGRGAEVDVRAAHAALLAQRALELDRAVGAVHARDVQDASLAGVLAGQRPREVERPVRVGRERAVVLAVRLGAGAPREGLDGVARERVLVEAYADEAARHVRLDGVDAVETQQLAPHLVHAPAALGGAGQQQRQFEAAFGQVCPPPSPCAPDRSSGPCSTCSRVMSRSTRMCASSGE